MDGDNIGMPEGGLKLSLLKHSVPKLGVIQMQKLEGIQRIQLSVSDQIDCGHATCAQDCLDHISFNGIANFKTGHGV